MNRRQRERQKGSTLIVVIMVAAFMLGVGGVLLMLTNTGRKISGNISTQEAAFNAAESGFETAKVVLEERLLSGEWADVDDHCLRLPAGIDLPLLTNYFRRMTDEQLVAAISPTSPGVFFHDEPYVKTGSGAFDNRYTYTVFLIDDEAGTGTTDATDVLMVCIGLVRSGGRIVSTSRLEILIGVTGQGTP